MTKFLGNSFCIESLTRDVVDLDQTAAEILSRVGPLPNPSWKYPDKIACELNVNQILNQYSDCDHIEDQAHHKQASHIVRMELVIDRLVLLLQAIYKFTDQITSVFRPTSTSNISKNQSLPSSSVGLLVTKFWAKLIQIHALCQQLHSQNKSLTKNIIALENQVENFSAQLLNTEYTGIAVDATVKDGVTAQKRSVSVSSISQDQCNKSTQTVESAFLPCEVCAGLQSCLKQVGSITVQACKTNNLPSTLENYMHEIDNLNWMSYNEIVRWTSEHTQDISRLQKRNDQLLTSNESLNLKLDEFSSTINKLEKKLQSCQVNLKTERETQSTMQKQYESRLKTLKQDSTDTIATLESNIENLQNKISNLSELLLNLQQNSDIQQKQLINKEVEFKTKLESFIPKEKYELIKDELNLLEQKVQVASTELHQEKIKNHNMTRRTESVQIKQERLVDKLKNLAEDNEHLSSKIIDMELLQVQLQENIQRAELDNSSLKSEIKMKTTLICEAETTNLELQENLKVLKNEFSDLETKMNEAIEREQLLVEYPDLNGPVNSNIKGCGDLVKDLENQVNANSARIHILEEQNKKLRYTISKFPKSQQKSEFVNKTAQYDSNLLKSPVRLWNPNSINIESITVHGTESNESFKDTTSEYIEQNSISSHQNSSIGAYAKLKKSGLLKNELKKGVKKSNLHPKK